MCQPSEHIFFPPQNHIFPKVRITATKKLLLQKPEFCFLILLSSPAPDSLQRSGISPQKRDVFIINNTEHCVLASFQADSLYRVGKVALGSPKPPSPLLIHKGKRTFHNSQILLTDNSSCLFGSHAHYLIKFWAQR